MVAPARPAATVAVLRDGAAGLETLMVLRPIRAEFVGGAQVFPGGRVDAADAEAVWERLTDQSRASARQLMGDWDEPGLPPALAVMVAAVRETFEETAILLGAPAREGSEIDHGGLRGRVHGGHVTFARAVEELAVRLSLSRMVYFARWVTPEALPRRYDTCFFAAPLPPGQEAMAAPGEIESLAWSTPRAALGRADTPGSYTLPPTRAVLEALARYRDVEGALEGLARDRDLAPILPQLRQAGSTPLDPGFSVILPGDPGYDTT